MKRKLRNFALSLAASFILVSAWTMLPGCASPNPTFNPAQPAVPPNVPYLANTNVAPILDALRAANAATAPANPYSFPIEIGLGAGAALAAWLAKRKNDQYAAAQATATQLAASVAAQPPTVQQAILDHASVNEAVYPAVADAINRKLGS